MAAGEPAGTGAYLFLGEQTLLYNVGIRSLQSGEEAFYTIVSAGVNWYEAEGSCEVLLLDEPLLEFSFRSMLGGEPIRAGMLLQDLPQETRRDQQTAGGGLFSGGGRVSGEGDGSWLWRAVSVVGA